MKKTIQIVLTIGILISVVLLILFFGSIKTEDIFGKTVSAKETQITFSGDEISSVDDLISSLSKLNRLEKVDLGSYQINVKDISRLKNALPGVDLHYQAYADLYGRRVNTDAVEIDLSGADLSDLGELSEALPYFTNLKRVISTTQTIPYEEKTVLVQTFPNVTFDVVSELEICGVLVRDDCEELDLRSAKISSDLAEELSRAPFVRKVDLHGQDLSVEDKISLVKALPDVQFGWEVVFNNKKFDSTEQEMDLSKAGRFSADDLRRFVAQFSQLKKVDATGGGISNEELADLRQELQPVQLVWTLTLGKWSLKTDQVAFSVLIYDYTHQRLRSKDIEVLKYCTDLQALDLGHQAISDISVIGDYLPELRILILADNAVSDLSPLSKLKHLHYLEFFVNSVKDLSPLAECKELVDLNISYNYGLKDITPILDLPLLERLWLEHTGISAADAQRLRERYPNAEVINQGEGSIDNGWRTHPRYFAMIDMFHKKNYVSELFSSYDQA